MMKRQSPGRNSSNFCAPRIFCHMSVVPHRFNLPTDFTTRRSSPAATRHLPSGARCLCQVLSEKEAQNMFYQHATEEGLDVDSFKTVVAVILSRDDGMIPGSNDAHINTNQVQCASHVCAFRMHACVLHVCSLLLGTCARGSSAGVQRPHRQDKQESWEPRIESTYTCAHTCV